jgi:hypothetical protein
MQSIVEIVDELRVEYMIFTEQYMEGCILPPDQS